MFLRPQHLQHADLFAEERLRYHLLTLNPFHWGVRELVINEDALPEHRVEVLKLDAVMPGGTVVRYPGNAIIETRDFDPESQRVDVHLALRRVSPTQPNAAPADNGARDVRYTIRPDELPDLNRGGSEAPIEIADANLRVFLSGEEEELEIHESFKLAELVATGELKQTFALSPSYCPPLLNIQAFPRLSDRVAQIVANIGAKVRVVAGRTTSMAIAELNLMWIRYTLARMTPVLNHLLSTGETQPFELYTHLVETAAALGAFNRQEAADLPRYDHEDLWRCYNELIDIIERELEMTVQVKFKEIPLEFDSARGYYVTNDLNTDSVDPRNAYYLGIKAPIDSKELVERMENEGKAGSISSVRVSVLTKTVGLRLEHVAPPTDIHARTGFEYFKVDPHNPRWAKIKDEFSFGLAIPKVESATVYLYVVGIGE